MAFVDFAEECAKKSESYRRKSGFKSLRNAGEYLNGHAARQFTPGQLERSASVILIYHTLKSIHNWLSYAAENRFYPPQFKEALRRHFST
jgi:hypothetical protein